MMQSSMGGVRGNKKWCMSYRCSDCSKQSGKSDDEEFEADCQQATVMTIHAHQEGMSAKLRERVKELPRTRMFHKLPFRQEESWWIQENTPVNKTPAETE